MLPNAVELVKQAAVEAVEATKPVQYLFGKVISVSPLKIQVSANPFTRKNADPDPERH